MSDSNQIQLSYAAEATWGTNPATTQTEMRWTGESFAYNIEYITSNEVRSDRQITDLIKGGVDAAGGFELEFSYASYDDFISAALMADWGTAVTSSGTVTSLVAGTFNIASPTSIASLATGQWIRTTGFSDTDLNAYYLVTAITGATLTVSPVPATGETGGSAELTGQMLRNGVIEKYFTIERRHIDLTPDVFFIYTGMMVNTFSMSLAANSVVTGAFDFIGEGCTVAATTGGNGTVTSANNAAVYSAVANVANILENNVAVNAALVQSIDFNLNNNLRGLDAVGQSANVDIGVGACEVTGTLNAYFLNDDLFTKYINSTATSISFRIQDGSNNDYVVTFHNVKFQTDALNASGSNTDVMENISWQALRDGTYDCTIQIDKFT